MKVLSTARREMLWTHRWWLERKWYVVASPPFLQRRLRMIKYRKTTRLWRTTSRRLQFWMPGRVVDITDLTWDDIINVIVTEEMKGG